MDWATVVAIVAVLVVAAAVADRLDRTRLTEWWARLRARRRRPS
ncbi:MAG TPA: hypothetical protein VKZ55_00385 [Microthrixaceae bacterium]|jgi:hypothetical protein|nr:hypothetical protein [Microthrixaceae bacterium]